MPVLVGVLAVLGVLVLTFLIFSGLVSIVCWAFSIAFSWKYVIGLVAAAIIYRWLGR